MWINVLFHPLLLCKYQQLGTSRQIVTVVTVTVECKSHVSWKLWFIHRVCFRYTLSHFLFIDSPTFLPQPSIKKKKNAFVNNFSNWQHFHFVLWSANWKYAQNRWMSKAQNKNHSGIIVRDRGDLYEQLTGAAHL